MRQSLLFVIGVAALVLQLSAASKADVQLVDGNGGPDPSRLAVIDLDAVARDIGWMTTIQSELEKCQQQLKAEIREHSTGAKGTDPKELKQLATAADQLFNRYRTELVRQSRQALTPLIESVAHEKRIAVVLVKTDTVIYFDRSIDITDIVVAHAREKPPELTMIARPHLFPDTKAATDAPTPARATLKEPESGTEPK